MTTIQTDYENNGETFWSHLTSYDVIHMARISEEARQVAADLCESETEAVTTTDEVAAELLDWFATLPGWSDGPEHAKHPVLFQKDDCKPMEDGHPLLTDADHRRIDDAWNRRLS